MARARVEQPPAATGTTLIVLVGLGIAFLLFMAFLNLVKDRKPLHRIQPALCGPHFLRWRGRSVPWLWGDGHGFVCAFRVTHHLGWVVGEHRGSGASLVCRRASAVCQCL